MSEEMHTLNEFMMQTKGVLYLLAVGYLIAFVGFWRFLHDREKPGK
jgi:hypothetical protein